MSDIIAWAYRDNRQAAAISDRRLAQMLDEDDDYTVSWASDSGGGR